MQTFRSAPTAVGEKKLSSWCQDDERCDSTAKSISRRHRSDIQCIHYVLSLMSKGRVSNINVSLSQLHPSISERDAPSYSSRKPAASFSIWRSTAEKLVNVFEMCLPTRDDASPRNVIWIIKHFNIFHIFSAPFMIFLMLAANDEKAEDEGKNGKV